MKLEPELPGQSVRPPLTRPGEKLSTYSPRAVTRLVIHDRTGEPVPGTRRRGEKHPLALDAASVGLCLVPRGQLENHLQNQGGLTPQRARPPTRPGTRLRPATTPRTEYEEATSAAVATLQDLLPPKLSRHTAGVAGASTPRRVSDPAPPGCLDSFPRGGAALRQLPDDSHVRTRLVQLVSRMRHGKGDDDEGDDDDNDSDDIVEDAETRGDDARTTDFHRMLHRRRAVNALQQHQQQAMEQLYQRGIRHRRKFASAPGTSSSSRHDAATAASSSDLSHDALSWSADLPYPTRLPRLAAAHARVGGLAQVALAPEINIESSGQLSTASLTKQRELEQWKHSRMSWVHTLSNGKPVDGVSGVGTSGGTGELAVPGTLGTSMKSSKQSLQTRTSSVEAPSDCKDGEADQEDEDVAHTQRGSLSSSHQASRHATSRRALIPPQLRGEHVISDAEARALLARGKREVRAATAPPAHARFAGDQRKAAIHVLLDRLRHPHPSVRVRACNAFHALSTRTAEVLDALLLRLYDADPGVRSAAARALSLIVDARDAATCTDRVMPLVLAANQPDMVRLHAACLLLSLDQGSDQDVQDVLRALLASALIEVRLEAARAIGLLPSATPDIVYDLQDLLHDPVGAVRFQACVALVRLEAHDEAVTEELTRRLRDRNWIIRMEAALTIGMLGSTDETLCAALVDVLHNDWNGFVRTAAARACDDLGFYRSAVKALHARLEDPDPLQRARAAKGVLALRKETERLVMALVSKLGDGSKYVKTTSIRTLGRLRAQDPRVINGLVDLLQDPDPAVGQLAATTLRALEIGAAEEKPPQDTSVVPQTAQVMFGCDTEQTISVLIEQLEHCETAFQRAEAASTLAVLGVRSAAVVAAVTRRITEERDSYVTARLLQCAASLCLDTPTLLQAVIACIDHEHSCVRFEAIGVFAGLPDIPPDTRRRLLQRLRDSDGLVRTVAAQVLSRTAVEPIEYHDLLPASKDLLPDVRSAVLKCIGLNFSTVNTGAQDPAARLGHGPGSGAHMAFDAAASSTASLRTAIGDLGNGPGNGNADGALVAMDGGGGGKPGSAASAAAKRFRPAVRNITRRLREKAALTRHGSNNSIASAGGLGSDTAVASSSRLPPEIRMFTAANSAFSSMTSLNTVMSSIQQGQQQQQREQEQRQEQQQQQQEESRDDETASATASPTGSPGSSMAQLMTAQLWRAQDMLMQLRNGVVHAAAASSADIDANVRYAAAKALRFIRSNKQEISLAMQNLIDDVDPRVRVEALWGLSSIRPRYRALERTMRAMLDDPSPVVATEAAKLMVTFTVSDDRVLPLLVDNAQVRDRRGIMTSWVTRSEAVAAISSYMAQLRRGSVQISTPLEHATAMASQVMLERLQDEAEEVRTRAATGLRRLRGEESAIETLCQMLDSPDAQQRLEAVRMMEKLRCKSTKVVHRFIRAMCDSDERVCTAAAAMLRDLGRDQVVVHQASLMLTHDLASERIAGTQLLRHLQGVPATATQQCQRMLTDMSWSVRASAAQTLADMGVRSGSLKLVLQQWTRSENWKVRVEGVKIMALFKGWSECLDILLLIARDPVAPVRAETARAISLLGINSMPVQILLTDLAADPEAFVRMEALKAMAVLAERVPLTAGPLHANSAWIRAAMTRVARDRVPFVRTEALRTLQVINIDDVDTLLNCMTNRQSTVREEASKTLSMLQLRTPKVQQCLLNALGDNNPLVRANSLHALRAFRRHCSRNADLGTPLAELDVADERMVRALLFKLGDPSKDVRIEAVQVLCHLNLSPFATMVVCLQERLMDWNDDVLDSVIRALVDCLTKLRLIASGRCITMTNAPRRRSIISTVSRVSIFDSNASLHSVIDSAQLDYAPGGILEPEEASVMAQQVISALVDCIQRRESEEDPTVRRVVIRAIRYLDMKTARSNFQVQSHLADPEKSVRLEALQTLQELQLKHIRGPLVTVTGDPEPAVRAKACEVMAELELGHDDIVRCLVALRRADPSRLVRDAASAAIKKLKLETEAIWLQSDMLMPGAVRQATLGVDSPARHRSQTSLPAVAAARIAASSSRRRMKPQQSSSHSNAEDIDDDEGHRVSQDS